MKNLYLTLLFAILFQPLVSQAQNLMTIGEVFDFEINDEFHFTYTSSYNGQDTPPNADRIKIIDKYYSTNGDTVFYVRFHDSYSSTLVAPQELVYSFGNFTDTVSYSNLDSSIATYYPWTPYDTGMVYHDTIIENSTIFCDSLINGILYAVNPFEPIVFRKEFGKGLGFVNYYYADAANFDWENSFLFYYKKNNLECGIPDLTTSSALENSLVNEFVIFPNPARGVLRIENKKNLEVESISLTNIHGQIVKQFDTKKAHLDISEIGSGLYFLKISSKNDVLSKKIIIE